MSRWMQVALVVVLLLSLAGVADQVNALKKLPSPNVPALLADGDSFLPDAVFRLRVVRAQLSYDNLVVEHIAGLGGEFAQLLGDAIKGSLDQWHPSLES